MRFKEDECQNEHIHLEVGGFIKMQTLIIPAVDLICHLSHDSLEEHVQHLPR